MLKKISRLLLLGMMVCAGSAYVTPTYASSASTASQGIERSIILTHIYPGVSGKAAHELVALYNTAPYPIEVTDWCVATKDTSRSLFCFNNTDKERYFIEPYGVVLIVSDEYADALVDVPPTLIDSVFEPSRRTSGGIVSSADTVRLIDAVGQEMDAFGWTSSPKKGAYIRHGLENFEDAVLDAEIRGGGLYRDGIVDTPSEEVDDSWDWVRLSELYPNPKGSDVGNEFIEVYNKGSHAVDLGEYAVRIIGGASNKVYRLPAGTYLEAGDYRALGDGDIQFSLNNTSGEVQLLWMGGATSTLIDSTHYANPKEGMSWSYFDVLSGGSWEYTAISTPNAKNSRDTGVSLAVGGAVQKPCADTQYRSPETGRCRKVTAPTTPAPCGSGKYRSQETGRCRSVATVKAPAPCKAGQERNPDTNRCRNIKKMEKVDHGRGVKATVSQGGVAWYAWALVGGIVLAVLAYGAWEWRDELRSVWVRLYSKKDP